MLLVAEMISFVGLIVPMPFKMKRKLFLFISESRLVAKLQYGLKVLFHNMRGLPSTALFEADEDYRLPSYSY